MLLKIPLFNRWFIHIPLCFGGKIQFDGSYLYKEPVGSGSLSVLVGKSVFFPRRGGSFSDMPHLYSVDTPWFAGVMKIDEKSICFPRSGIKMPLL